MYGSFLAEKTNLVLIGCWHEQIAALNRKGLTVIRPDGMKHTIQLLATEDVSEISPADIVFVLVKSYQTGQKSQTISRLLHPEGLVVSLQNGIGSGEVLAEAVGKNRVVEGITHQAATLLSPGLLKHAGSGTTFLADRPDHAGFMVLLQLLAVSGIAVKVVQDIQSYQWAKLVANAAINPLTALLEVANGKLLQNRRSLGIMITIVREVAGVAGAAQIKLPINDPVEYVKSVCAASADNHSSMLQDMRRGAPTEIDSISGAIVRVAHRLEVPVPVNEKLLRLIKAKSAGRRFGREQIYAELLS